MDVPPELHLMILRWSLSANSVARIDDGEHLLSTHRRLDSIDKFLDIRNVCTLLRINRYIRQTIFQEATFHINVAAETNVHGKGVCGCAGMRSNHESDCTLHQARLHCGFGSPWNRHVSAQTFSSFSRYNIHVEDVEGRHYPMMLDELSHVLAAHGSIKELNLICTVSTNMIHYPSKKDEADWRCLLKPLRCVRNVEKAEIKLRILPGRRRDGRNKRLAPFQHARSNIHGEEGYA